MNRLALFLILCVCGCKTAQDLKKVNYFYWDGLKKKGYKMRIPSGFNLQIIQADGEAGLEKQYWYADSSVIYISNMMNHLNYENIKNKEGAFSKDFQAFAANDTLTLEGQDSNGLYWKNKRLKNVCVGYANTPLSKKEIFDTALESIKSQ